MKGKKRHTHSSRKGVILSAMSLWMPEDDVTKAAPNRHPWSGVLCTIDAPSDKPPEGAGGKRVLLPKSVAEKILPTLLGQAVDWIPDLSGHNPKVKVGVILEAHITGTEIAVSGIIYDVDFPEVVPAIRANAGLVGMSFELDAIFALPDPAAPSDVATIIDSTGFTGAAILLAKGAAYTTTRLAANAAKKGLNMDPKELAALMAAAIAEANKPLMAQLNALQAQVKAGSKKTGKEAFDGDIKDLHEMHAKAADLHKDLTDELGDVEGEGDMSACKAAAKSLGDHLKSCHAGVKAMKAEAGNYFAKPTEAAKDDKADEEDGKLDKEVLKETKEIKDKLKAAEAEVASLKARAEGTIEAPARKTLSPEITTLLAKGGLTADTSNEPTKVLAQVDQALDKLGVSNRVERYAAKMTIQND